MYAFNEELLINKLREYPLNEIINIIQFTTNYQIAFYPLFS